MIKQYIFLIKAIPKPRMTQRDKWAKRPIVVKYFSYKDSLNSLALKNDFKLPDTNCKIDFLFKAKSAKLIGMPHKKKPDIDNLLKAVFDCLKKHDQTIYNISASKYYSNDDMIIFTIYSDIKYE